MQERKNAPIVYDKDISKSNIIISQNIGDLNNLEQRILEDFLKSGIPENVVINLAQAGFLTGMPDGWKLFYPELFENKVSDYYTWKHFSPDMPKYTNKAGECSRMFRPFNLPLEILKNSENYIIITEGEKKAIKAVQEGFNCIALSGVWSWKRTPKDDDVRNKEEYHESNHDIIPDILNLNFNQRVIYLCFDNDFWVKPAVRQALYQFAGYLIGERQANVKIIKIPSSDDKLGLDDYLIKYGKTKFQELIDKAQQLALKDIQCILSGDSNVNIHFPIEIFSEPLQTLIMGLQKRLDAPLEYIAITFLTVASMLMNERFAINVNPSSDWIEYPILWSILVGNPSHKKTPCLKIGKKILDKFEETMQADYDTALEKYNIDYQKYKVDYEVYKSELKKGNNATLPIEPPKPAKAHLTVQNTTVEALCTFQNANKETNRPLNIYLDELAFLLKGFNQYKKGGNDVEYFLQTWSKNRQTILRQNIEYTITASHNIIGSIQPRVLDETLFSNGVDTYNGMVERWLYVLTEYNSTGELPTCNEKFDVSEFEKRCERIFNINKVERTYYLSKEAAIVFKNCLATSNKYMKYDKFSDLTKNYIQKQNSYIARFALILHCLENPETLEIEDITIKKAISLSKYFVSCFLKLTADRISVNPIENYTLSYLRTKGKRSISPTELRKSNTSRYKTLEYAQFALENLANKGYGRMCKSGTRGSKFILYS